MIEIQNQVFDNKAEITSLDKMEIIEQNLIQGEKIK